LQESLIKNKSRVTFTATQKSILSALCYADVFYFPLKKNEIIALSNFEGKEDDFKTDLEELKKQQIIREENNFYLLFESNTSTISTRLQREKAFHESHEKVKRYSRRVAAFPFVKGVYISGSYSKGVMGESDDIDYFIVTTSGRLWLCRSLLRGFKKFFLQRSEKYFCMNYFLEEDHLEVPDKNIFVAHEVRSIVPATNLELYKRFQEANSWTNQFLPNKPLHDRVLVEKPSLRFLGRFFEVMLSGSIGNWLEKRFFSFMEKRRKRKFRHFSEEEFNLNMRTQKHAEKHHPAGTQFRVLNAYEQRMKKFDFG
jgi:hypothetical protein